MDLTVCRALGLVEGPSKGAEGPFKGRFGLMQGRFRVDPYDFIRTTCLLLEQRDPLWASVYCEHFYLGSLVGPAISGNSHIRNRNLGR